MFKNIDGEQMKAIFLIGLILGSIFLVRYIPVEITHSDAFRAIHCLDQ